MMVIRCGLVAALSLAAVGVNAQGLADSTRRPRGIYAVDVVDEGRPRRAADFDALLANPAVSGLAVRMFWSSLQPAKDRFDFSKLDAAFASAAAKHKTIQLILLPGFGTPSWVLDELPSCDDLHADASAARGGGGRGPRGGGRGRAQRGQGDSASCGKQSFDVSEGGRRGQQKPLPLPWNATYKNYWRAFLTQVASRYGSNEAFVSIAVTGPTAESAEIIVPRAGDQLERWAELLELAYRDPSYHRTDKAFVEEWDAAVTMFADVFKNVTLVVTRGSGLPNFSPGQGAQAQTAIVSQFARHATGSNAKATQTSGMKACRETEGGILGVKEMSGDKSLRPPVLGGAQFDTSFSQKPAVEGCAASCDASAAACQGLTPKDALANVLSVYFDRTPASPMNYLQVYAPDIIHAGSDPAVQALLQQASQRLLAQAR